MVHNLSCESLLQMINFFSIEFGWVTRYVPLFFSLHLHLSHQHPLIRLLFVYHSLQIAEVSLQKTTSQSSYVIFWSLCRTCQLRFLYIDFCLWSSLITVGPLLLFLCLLSIIQCYPLYTRF